METAIVTNIQGYSIHDGPGIRTVVFMKGCPLRCRWCANPENLSAETEVGFLHNLCQTCGRCAGACEYGAILPGESVDRINRERCARCLKCVDTCYYGALVRYGEEMTSGEVYERTRRDKMFYDSSGGGVTFSGGEPLLYPKFVAEVFSSLRLDGIGTCIETCGAVTWEAFESVRPYTDIFYFDLKLMDAARHLELTGMDNVAILENARRLVGSGANVMFRKPLVPGVNDGGEETAATSEFLLGLGVSDLELMPYHAMGDSKYRALAMEYEMKDVPASEPAVANAREMYEKFGINCVISK